MGVVHTSRMRIEKHEGPHRTAHLEGFGEPVGTLSSTATRERACR
jgi:hypothetical protein